MYNKMFLGSLESNDSGIVFSEYSNETVLNVIQYLIQ